ncbi:hypothetical protein CDAR_176791 [Caerostris darwini]|uniref:Uncharacterized protein n=1 Tax=Caerostris darwini TaxID=1538125 RepID=A0AAV4PSD3_9ARAC|nr:hypothetical protein CDAR_176791 [Caerostris darwini]
MGVPIIKSKTDVKSKRDIGNSAAGNSWSPLGSGMVSMLDMKRSSYLAINFFMGVPIIKSKTDVKSKRDIGNSAAGNSWSPLGSGMVSMLDMKRSSCNCTS